LRLCVHCEDGDVLVEVALAHPAERTEERAQGCPQAREGVVVNLADLVSLVLTSLLPLAWGVVHGAKTNVHQLANWTRLLIICDQAFKCEPKNR
jgi:hypothetical protein